MDKVAFSSWNGKIVDNREGKASKASKPVDVVIPRAPRAEKANAFMGWNGIVVNSPDADIVSLTLKYLEEARKISCGECSVCMIGIDRLVAIIENLDKEQGGKTALAEMEAIVKQVAVNSKCGFGQSALFPVADVLKYYKADLMTFAKRTKTQEGKGYEIAVTAPCVNACPASLDIPGYIELIRNNKFEESLELIRRDCVLPGIVGRVCTHPCEDACVRKDMDGPLAIRLLKRAAADFDLQAEGSVLGSPKQEKADKVAVIGAGPAGLAAAYNLRRMGYDVTVFESLPQAGGMAAVGIPEFRLPTDILNHEIDLIRRTGVEIRLNTRIEKIDIAEFKKQGYKAVYVAVGAHKGNAIGAEGEDQDYEGFIDGVELLRNITLGKNLPQGERAVIVGGGNAAIDCARSCLRIGFDKVEIAYRRSRAEMPAMEEEVTGAEDEGVKIRFLVAPTRIIAENGKVTGLECIKMKLGEPDESGRRRPVPVAGSEFVINTDIIVSAIGQSPALPQFKVQPKITRWGTLEADPVTYMTSIDGLFTGGDCFTGPATLIEALNMGNQVARSIDCYLQGGNMEPKASFDGTDLKKQRGKGFVLSVPQEKVAHLDPTDRAGNFREVEKGFSASEAMKEAQRCLRCYRVMVWEKA